jgi:hypothetical protein
MWECGKFHLSVAHLQSLWLLAFVWNKLPPSLSFAREPDPNVHSVPRIPTAWPVFAALLATATTQRSATLIHNAGMKAASASQTSLVPDSATREIYALIFKTATPSATVRRAVCACKPAAPTPISACLRQSCVPTWQAAAGSSGPAMLRPVMETTAFPFRQLLECKGIGFRIVYTTFFVVKGPSMFPQISFSYRV